MRDSLTSENTRDFSQRYNKTFGWLLNENARTLVRVDSVGEDAVFFSDVNGFKYNAKKNAGVQFEFLPVTRGCYNTKGYGPVFVQRIPARQWHRGICAANTSFNVYTKYGVESIGVDIKTVSELFGRSSGDTTALLKGFLNGTTEAVALNKFFVLHGKNVFFYDKKIGSIDGDVISGLHPLFVQELGDCIARNKFKLKIAQ